MTAKKIILHTYLDKYWQDFFIKNLENFEHLFLENISEIDKLTDLEKQNIVAISLFIYDYIDQEFIANLPGLKTIVTRSTGTDHIPVDLLIKNKINYYNLPIYSTNSVAEQTLGLLLAAARNIDKLAIRTQNFDFTYKDLNSYELGNKTLGIIGTGRIGQKFLEICSGFNFKILAFDFYQTKKLTEKYDLLYTDLDTLLQNSDIISLHLPLTEQTRNFLSDNQFKKMVKQPILLNSSRGFLIDNKALVKALENKQIKAFAADTIAGEHLFFKANSSKAKIPKEIQKILSFENVVYTPHTAYYTKESMKKANQYTLDILQKIQVL